MSVEEALEIARQTPLENVAALVPFFEQLYRHQNGSGDHRLHILHYGDSHTAADEWTGFLRALFQNRFGDGGAGWTHAGKPWSSFRRLDVSSDATPGWRAEGLLGRPSDGWNGLAGVSITTQKPGESVLLEASCDWLEVFYLRQPGGGSLNFYDNGVLVDRIDTQGERGAGFYRYAPVPGPHHFRLETVDAAPVRLFGWAAEQGHGVTYEMLGINGAQASIVFQWEEPLLAEHIARRNPALLVFAYGTNEASNFDWNRENYRHMFASLIQRFRRMAPTASILVIGPPDRSVRWRGGWRTFDAVDRIVEAQREAALGTGCAFWDLRAKMGGKGSMPRWVSAGLAQRDYVHFTAAGYRLIGGAIFEDLMNHYATFVKVRSQWMGQDFDKRNGQKSDNP
ncbi:MAG: SGNH/GDSL hydrolase family protein [Bryobacteraceae bacterium]|nr:SGNH/GDSL hydrolase family protein [Bryobacteraceae bacterium]MDW8379828.1 SGNH/GDSL hydrolase family protein [Bryobacterales bacterium]